MGGFLVRVAESFPRVLLALSACVTAAACSDSPSQSEEAAASHGALTSLNPQDPIAKGIAGGEVGLSGGRFTAVVVDPTNALNAYATSEGGGFYLSHDGGQSWQTTFAADGTKQPVGVGFSRGVVRLTDLAISSDGADLLVMADDDNRTDNKGAGIWHSTDQGQTSDASPQITPKVSRKTACSRTMRSKASIRGRSHSSRIVGRHKYQ